MRKHISGRKLQRDTNERKALFKSLMSSLVLHESITTTEAKAKAVKGAIEKIVTKAKKQAKQAKQAERILRAHFSDSVLKKLINDIAPRFANRPGGYTRIIKLGNRLQDNAKMVKLEWVEKKEQRAKNLTLKKDVEEKTELPEGVQEGEIIREEKKVTKKAQAKTKSATNKKKAEK